MFSQLENSIFLWDEDCLLDDCVEIVERPTDQEDGLRDRILTHIKCASLKIVKPSRPNGKGLLILPGGGFSHIVLDKESEEISPTFTAQGYTLFILTYRLPGDGHYEKAAASFVDAQRAMRLIRTRQQELGIEIHSLGVMGFSAGGYVAASLGVRYARKVDTHYCDMLGDISARPDFMVLMYPVISMMDAFCHPGSKLNLLGVSPSSAQVEEHSLELQVHPDVPPTLLIHAIDDELVPYENTLSFFHGLKQNQIRTEMHLFEKGGHGFSLRGTHQLPVAGWPELVDRWVKAL